MNTSENDGMSDEKLISLDEVAEQAGLHKQTLLVWKRQGKPIPIFRVGSRWKARPSEVQTWLRFAAASPKRSKATA